MIIFDFNNLLWPVETNCLADDTAVLVPDIYAYCEGIIQSDIAL